MAQKRQILQMFLSTLISPSHKPTKRPDSPSPPSQTTYALRGGLGGGHSPTQWGVWGSEPPDPGSVLTSNNRNPQVFIIYRSASHLVGTINELPVLVGKRIANYLRYWVLLTSLSTNRSTKPKLFCICCLCWGRSNRKHSLWFQRRIDSKVLALQAQVSS